MFFATLTWSLGCAITTAVALQGILGWPLVRTAVLGFAASSFIASELGRGFMDITPAAAGNPLETLFRIVGIAMQTYGVLGAIFGAGIGIWLGFLLGRNVSRAAT